MYLNGHMRVPFSPFRRIPDNKPILKPEAIRHRTMGCTPLHP